MVNRFTHLRATLLCCVVCLLFSGLDRSITLQAAPGQQPLALPNPILFVTQVPIVAGDPVFTIAVISSIKANGETSRGVRVGVRTAEELLKPGTKVEGALIEVEGQGEFAELSSVAGNGNLVTVMIEDTAILNALIRGSRAKVIIPTQAGAFEKSFSLSGSRKAIDQIKRCL